MKVSEIKVDDVKKYLRITENDDDNLLELILKSAKSYIKRQVGIDDKEIDTYPDLTVAVLIICQDLYDNRSVYVDKNNLNRTVDNIIFMHRGNLIG